MNKLLKKITAPLFVMVLMSASLGCTSNDSNKGRLERETADDDNQQLTSPTPIQGTDIGERTTKGTHHDSMKTAANPLYKGDNSDTGKLRDNAKKD